MEESVFVGDSRSETSSCCNPNLSLEKICPAPRRQKNVINLRVFNLKGKKKINCAHLNPLIDFVIRYSLIDNSLYSHTCSFS